MSLKNKMLLLVVAAMVLVLSFAIFINTRINEKALYETAMSSSESYFSEIIYAFNDMFKSVSMGTVSLSDIASVSYDLYSTGIVENPRENLDNLVYRFYKSQIDSRYIIANGIYFEPNIIYSNTNINGLYSLYYLYDLENANSLNSRTEDDYTNEDFYKKAISENLNDEVNRFEKVYYSAPYSKYTDKTQMVISASSPIYSTSNGNAVGVALSDISLDMIYEYITNINKEGPFNSVIFDDVNKKIIYHDDTNYILKDLSEVPFVNDIADNINFDADTKIFENYDYEKEFYTLFIRRLDNGRYNLLTYIPQDYFYDASNRINKIVFLILIAAVLVIVVALIVVLSIFLKPLKRMSAELEEGVFNNNVFINITRIKSKDVFGDISNLLTLFFDMVQRVFSTMVKTLKVSKEQNDSIKYKISNISQEADSMTESVNLMINYIARHREEFKTVENNNLEIYETITSSLSEILPIDDITNDLQSKIDDQFSNISRINSLSSDMQTEFEEVALTITKAKEESEQFLSLVSIGKEEFLKTESLAKTLISSTKGISDFINSAIDMSQQINILSMNAAIEAAHAGEHGKGFGVVVEEIRKLAVVANLQSEKAQQILRDIEKQISMVMSNIDKRIAAMEDKISKVRNFVAEMTKAKKVTDEKSVSMIEICSFIERMPDMVKEIKEQYKILHGRIHVVKDNFMHLSESSKNNDETIKTISNNAEDSVSKAKNMGEYISNIFDLIKEIEKLSSVASNSVSYLQKEMSNYVVRDLDELIKDKRKSMSERERGYAKFKFVKDTYGFITDVLGKEKLANILKRMPEDSKLIFGEIKKMRFRKKFSLSSSFFSPMTAIIDECYENSKDAVIDRAKYDYNKLGLFVKLAVRLSSGRSLANMFMRFNNKRFKNINFEMVKSDKNIVIYHLYYFPNYDPMFETYYYEILGNIFRQKYPNEAKVEITKSINDGYIYTEYVVTW